MRLITNADSLEYGRGNTLVITYHPLDAASHAAQGRRHMSEWQDISTAPKDGTEVFLPLEGKIRAFWSDDLKKWVFSQALHMETVANPSLWMPIKPPKDAGT